MYCMDTSELPLKGNYNQYNYKIYFKDTGLLIGSLDEEAQVDFFYCSLLFNIFLKRFLCDERHQNVLSKLEVIKSE